MNLLAKQKESHRLRKWTHGGKGMAGDFRKVMYTLLCLEWITKRNLLLQHMELCSVLCVRLDGRGVWGRMDTCICMAESLHCLPETITTLLISYTPIQNALGVKKKKRISLFVKICGYNMCAHDRLLQSCVTLCNLMYCSPPGSFGHGIL